jgi:hypothetical protein
MAAMYGPLQLCCALKPSLLLHLLSTEATPVVYLDADVEVFAPLLQVAELAGRHELVLTPHLTEPPPVRTGEELARFLTGSFNAGFLAVGPDSDRFLRWWRERLARYCVHRPQEGYFDDQRWLDLVPTYFPHHVLRDPGCNVGFWNVQTRPVEWDGACYRVQGSPLRFFHFGGFDIERPRLLSRWLGATPHTLLSEHPALHRLCGRYAARVRQNGHDGYKGLPYAYGVLDDGSEIDSDMRRAYRNALLAAEAHHVSDPPNPLSAGAAPWRSWRTASRSGARRATTPPRRLRSQHADRLALTVGMSWNNERAYCHWYGRRLYSGAGAIVDLGCWLGSLTVPLAMGVADNPDAAARTRRIHAYDLFRWTPQMEEVVAGTPLAARYEPDESFRDAFEREILPWRDRIEIHEADLSTASWDGGEIEFLLIDAMKSWQLAHGILCGFFHALVPGRGLVMHQDFAHFATYWIHLLNFRLRNCLELEYEIPWASGVVFRLVAPVPDELLRRQLSIDDFETDEIEEAFEYALALVSDRKRPEVAAAQIMALAEKGELDRARHELERWSRFRWPPPVNLPQVAEVLAQRAAENQRMGQRATRP